MYAFLKFALVIVIFSLYVMRARTSRAEPEVADEVAPAKAKRPHPVSKKRSRKRRRR